MNENALSCCSQPLIMKNKNVSFDCCPCKEHCLKCITSIIDVDPNKRKEGILYERHSGEVVVDEPWCAGQVRDEIGDENDDDDVIVECLSKCSIEKEMVENEDRCEYGDDVWK